MPLIPDLSVIIVNWNGGEFLRRCLRNLLQYPPSCTYEILVVDNCSTDDSLAWLRSLQAELGGVLRIIENSGNVGFPKANNQAIASSQSPLIFLLNPDADVSPGAIDKLVQLLKSDSRIGACAPRLLNTDGTLQHSVWPNPPTPWNIVFAGSPLARLLTKRTRGELLLGTYWDHSRRRPVPFVTGAALMVKRAMIDELGALDERFAMYAEDHEFCLRIIRSGWRLWFEPAASVVHHGGRSAAQRWKDGVVAKQQEAFFRFQEIVLPRYHFLANLMATWFVLHVNSFLYASRMTSLDLSNARTGKQYCSAKIHQLLSRPLGETS
jgi:N-acetylglucosaminyl-diphospho-decaprenol L-rhamnosyltransferase